MEIYVGKKPLTDTRGEEVGAMNNDTFVEFSGSDGDVYSYDTFTLYFTNKNGDKLVAEQRSVRYRRKSSEGYGGFWSSLQEVRWKKDIILQYRRIQRYFP